jgi:hypothetical protein
VLAITPKTFVSSILWTMSRSTSAAFARFSKDMPALFR